MNEVSAESRRVFVQNKRVTHEEEVFTVGYFASEIKLGRGQKESQRLREIMRLETVGASTIRLRIED